MLRVENAQKTFDGFKAVNGAHLSVENGEIVAVIGPNGAGKTTLFNIITGQLKPDGGEFWFSGENINALPPHRICKKGIARSFQIANIFHRLTVFRNVQVSVLSQRSRNRNVFFSSDRFFIEDTHAILESVGLKDKQREIAGALSHGDRRLLEIAVALGTEPRLLILDEPTAGMSPEETAATISLIKQLAETRGLTILFCEHDMEVVFGVSNRIMVMEQGRTLIQGTPAEIQKNPEVQRAYLGAE
jgi:branched-chain amino acid transport system ATP-binding protein